MRPAFPFRIIQRSAKGILITLLWGAAACSHSLTPPRSPAELAIRTNPERALTVFNRAAALEDHAAEAEFARGFQASLFHPNTPGTPAQHARVRRIMRKVLRAWPVPLRGYDYSVTVERTAMPNAFAYGDGRLGFTTGMLDGVGMTDAELEMIMAHEVAHTELRHSNRMRKVVLRGQMINAAALGFALGMDTDWAWLTAEMVTQITNFGFAGFSRDREREADALARFYLDSVGIGPRPAATGFGKMLAFKHRHGARFSEYAAYASHPPTPERIDRARDTETFRIDDWRASVGYDTHGQIRAGFQPVFLSHYGSEVDVIGVLTTPPYDTRRPVGSLYVRLGGRLLEFRERTAENTDPGTSAPVVFRGGLPEGVGLADLADAAFGPQIAGVERWERQDLNLYAPGVGSVWAKPETRPAGS